MHFWDFCFLQIPFSSKIRLQRGLGELKCWHAARFFVGCQQLVLTKRILVSQIVKYLEQSEVILNIHFFGIELFWFVMMGFFADIFICVFFVFFFVRFYRFSRKWVFLSFVNWESETIFFIFPNISYLFWSVSFYRVRTVFALFWFNSDPNFKNFGWFLLLCQMSLNHFMRISYLYSSCSYSDFISHANFHSCRNKFCLNGFLCYCRARFYSFIQFVCYRFVHLISVVRIYGLYTIVNLNHRKTISTDQSLSPDFWPTVFFRLTVVFFFSG